MDHSTIVTYVAVLQLNKLKTSDLFAGRRLNVLTSRIDRRKMYATKSCSFLARDAFMRYDVLPSVRPSMVWYGVANVDLYSAIVTKSSSALNTLVPREKPGFQALFKGLIVLLCTEIFRQRVPDHGAVRLCTANAWQPTMDRQYRGTTISCCVADLRRW